MSEGAVSDSTEGRCFEEFCGCTYEISFSCEMKVSIKNDVISVHIKYSVRDRIYDIHFCAWTAMIH